MKNSGYKTITDEEAEKLIMALANGQETFTELDAEIVLRWAHEMKIYAAVLNLVLQGLVVVSVDDMGEVKVRLKDGVKEHMDKYTGDVLDSDLIQ